MHNLLMSVSVLYDLLKRSTKAQRQINLGFDVRSDKKVGMQPLLAKYVQENILHGHN